MISNIRLFFLFLAMVAVRAHAANYKGGELLYEWLHDSTYQFTLKLYGPCDAAITPLPLTSVCYYNDCDTRSGHIELLPIAMPSTVSPAYREYHYRGSMALPSRCHNWVFYASISLRDSSRNSQFQPGQSTYLEATLNNSLGPVNSSPIFNNAPPAIISNNIPYTLNPGCSDPNGDSLSFELLPLRTAADTYNSPSACRNSYAATDISFSSLAYNLVNNPFATGNTLVLNPLTGQMSFTPQGSGTVAYALRANKYRAGVKIGAVMRDVQLTISDLVLAPQLLTGLSDLVNCTQTPGGIVAPVNIPMGFCMNAWVGNHSVTHLLGMFSNAALVMPGSNAQLTGQYTDSASLCLIWTPAMADTGLHLLTFTVRDSTVLIPCVTPLAGIVDATYTIPVFIQSPNKVAALNPRPAVNIYPNPAANIVYIDAPVAVTTVICHADGRPVARTSARQLDIQLLAGGLYFVHVYDAKNNLLRVEKLVKLPG